MGFYQDHRAGSARWAQLPDVEAAGLCRGRGFHLGFFEGRALASDDDGPVFIAAGSGAGKLTSCVGWHAINDPGRNVFVDIKGEITVISIHNQVRMGKAAYVLNPHRMHGLPSHVCNVLAHLRPDSITLRIDIKLIAEFLIPSKSGGDGKFFEDQARAILEAFILYDVLARGRTSLPRVKRMVDVIQGDVGQWQSLAEAMAAIGDEDIAATIDALVTMQLDAGKTFASVMAEVRNGLAFLTDPAVRDALDEDADFTLEQALCDPVKPANVYVVVSGEMMGVLATYVRAVLGISLILKGRSPSTPRVTFVVDEAPQLGKADFLLRSMTVGRGLGARTILIAQDLGALRRVYGSEAEQTFLASSPTQLWFGIRDRETASLLSRSSGVQSLYYDDRLQQQRAAHARVQAIRSAMDGGGIGAALEARHQARLEGHQMMVARPLITEDEALRMPDDLSIVRVSGTGCPPILVSRPRYYEDRHNAGRYHPNPYVGSQDTVQVRGLLGMKTVRVIREPVPDAFAHLPQYCGGEWSYIEGYRPA
ncbi:type IV secretion system protein VirD4 [Caulobacter ginsengisoli]|uniref:Type IV secretion system protein VirD4 n=1 Tax=Caulobacter ginsengisoli TaxID=400775 RepID=A0ABU0IU82_9CAUL|nr:type IV secretory system conjugative DNA transfer family protein [Caulobacter ginsengisoli]MDQ0465564.1 type IV secretion system protein VirD4 [Caulobacter ginsengisoli]